jgi:tRNA(fMet)-specific endonuclease VapC
VIACLLDTNVVIALLAGRSATLANRVMIHPPGSIALPAIVLHELYFGAHRSAQVQHNLETIRLLAADFPILDFGRDDALASGEIRARLAALGTPIGPYDALIAGQAMARNLMLVTNNTREFQRVEGLRIDDWTL